MASGPTESVDGANVSIVDEVNNKPHSIDGANVSIVDEDNNKPHHQLLKDQATNQLFKDYATAVGTVDLQFPPRSVSDSSFDREWRMSEKLKSQAITLVRGDGFDDVIKDEFTDTDEEETYEVKTPFR